MRIALLGELVEGSGVRGLNYRLVEGLLKQGISVDYYGNEFPKKLLKYKNCKPHIIKSNWSWNRWYSKLPFMAFVSGTLARIQMHTRLSNKLIEVNARNPYDCMLQLSQSELFKLGKRLNKLPPIIVFPFCHAAGELKWIRKEKAYAIESQGALVYHLARLVFTYRSLIQKRELKKPNLVIGLSHKFNQLLSVDYGLSSKRQRVVYSPVKLQDSISAKLVDEKASGRKVIKLIFVSRISSRKGLQGIISLSKRLNDLAGQIQIDVVGEASLWSDYTKHLNKLNTQVARYLGGLEYPKLNNVYDSADILLVPSLYEPGGIVVPEALSHGVYIVASDAVGNAEMLERDCCRVFPAGDIDAFEKQVRSAIDRVRHNRMEIRKCARIQAQKYFDPDKSVKRLIGLLQKVIESKENS